MLHFVSHSHVVSITISLDIDVFKGMIGMHLKKNTYFAQHYNTHDISSQMFWENNKWEPWVR